MSSAPVLWIGSRGYPQVWAKMLHKAQFWKPISIFPGLKGVFVPIEETIRGFNMIMDGEVDEYPEAAFNLVGTIDDAIEKGKKILAEANA